MVLQHIRYMKRRKNDCYHRVFYYINLPNLPTMANKSHTIKRHNSIMQIYIIFVLRWTILGNFSERHKHGGRSPKNTFF